jgi:hypothetical protein
MRDGIHAKIAENIQRFGQHLVRVHAGAASTDDFEPFVYSIGNHAMGFPELLFVGDNDEWCCNILNILGRIQRERGSAFLGGEKVDYTAQFPALIMDAGQRGRDEYAVQVGVFFGTDEFNVCQILLPDQNGRYPGEAGCLPPYCEQVVLGRIH